ncbi:MAG TPA: cbb3-type cytochrome c oxidase subunit I [Candidatus Acidoferrales bacterium]|nr:cbb3-type cytochrome c oxidase subunit I [Candidatus Acidoferrales bacterium]
MLRARNSISILFFALAAFLLAIACYASYFLLNWPALDLYIHDTYYVIGHRIPLLSLSLYFAACGLAYYVYPRIVHKQLSRFLAHLHFWASLGFLTLLFFAYHSFFATGAASLAASGDSLKSAFVRCSLSMLGLAAAQIILIINFVWSFLREQRIRTASPPA